MESFYVDAVMKLIEQEREQYQEFVEAGIAFYAAMGGVPTGAAARRVIKAVQPFIPPKPRMGLLKLPVGETETWQEICVKAIECTPEVEAAIKAAGIEYGT
jgi:hypothetical protein